MPVRVHIPTPMRQHTEGQAIVEVSAANVKAALDALGQKYPALTQRLFENGQARMGRAPWDDLGRYLRNSPIFYVERVDTPLLIMQGDMDYVAMQQGEEFFNALYRQGKRAE